jgi:glutamyl-tRNA synthetase
VDHQILLKSDGFPTYHLANVVDDHLMGITHVIRGEEWLPSLPKHLLLYRYFNWQAPVVYHLPLLRNADQSKLSKRKNPTSILYYRELGILPEALLNFLGTFAYTMPGGEEIFSLEQMVESFDIGRISLGGPIFDLQKLTWTNQKHIAALNQEQLLTKLIDWRFNPEYLARLIPLMNQRMHKLGDFMALCDFMFHSDVAVRKESLLPPKRDEEAVRELLYLLLWELEQLPFPSHQEVEAACRKIGELQNWNLRDLTFVLRQAVCGRSVAPPLFHVVEILGGDICRNRLLAAIQQMGPLPKKKLDGLQEDWRKRCADYPPSSASVSPALS